MTNNKESNQLKIKQLAESGEEKGASGPTPGEFTHV